MPETATTRADAVEAARWLPEAWAWLCTRGTWVAAAHLRLILRQARETIERGGRLIVTTPPRHGKSMALARFLTAWFLGKRPDSRVVVASHSWDLASGFGRAARDDFRAFGPEVFGKRVNEAAHAKDAWDVDGHAGGFKAVGIGSSLTGKGADLLVIDDYCPDADAALSPVQRQSVWAWWESTASTRLEPGAACIVIATRWHDDDLIGRLLTHEPGRWDVLHLPALAEDGDALGRSRGDALWPERWPREVLEQTRATKGSFWWSAMYQGAPVPEGGGIFQAKWCERRWTQEREGAPIVAGDERLLHSDLFKFMVVDPAVSEKQAADRSAVSTLGMTPKGKLILLDVFADRVGDVLPTLIAKRATWDVPVVWMEDAGQFILLIRAARSAGLPVRCYGRKEEHALRLPSGGGGDPKVPVFRAAAPFVEQGRLWLPRQAAWLADAEAELWKVPFAAHDDVAETIAVACLLAQEGLVGDNGSLALANASLQCLSDAAERARKRRLGIVDDDEDGSAPTPTYGEFGPVDL